MTHEITITDPAILKRYGFGVHGENPTVPGHVTAAPILWYEWAIEAFPTLLVEEMDQLALEYMAETVAERHNAYMVKWMFDLGYFTTLYQVDAT